MCDLMDRILYAPLIVVKKKTVTVLIIDVLLLLSLQGTYSSGNATSCVVCPAGSYCPSTDIDLPISCATGTYAEEGQTVSFYTIWS